MKTGNPEKDFDKTPKRFGGVSKIVGIEKEDSRRGIILDNLDEFAKALLVYDEGCTVEGASETQNVLLQEIEKKDGSLGLGIALLAGLKNATDFTETLIKQAISELELSGRFHKSFDYGGYGTNFFKTTVEGKKVGDKYVLELYAAYVGREPENKLAEVLKKPMALISSNVKGKLNTVDTWWFNVNLEDVLQGLPLPKKQMKNIRTLPEYIVSGYIRPGKRPEFGFKHNGKKFVLDIELDAAKYLRPEGSKGDYYLEARGNTLVGGAWDHWDETSSHKVAPRIVQPSILLSITFPGEIYSRPVAVTTEQMTELQKARDYITKFIKKDK